MFTRPLKAMPLVVLTMAAVAWSIGWASTEVYAQHNHMMHRGQQRTTTPARPRTTQPATTRQAAGESPGPHGGRLTTISYLAFEVVYQPHEIRVYVYGPSQQPQSARDVQGEVGLRRLNSTRTFTGTLQYVAPPPGTSEQDYLAVRANLSGVNDGDMMSTVRLTNLPFRNRSEVTYSQAVVVSNAKPQVTLAALDQSDQAGVARQRVCPVTGAALDSMGGPIKVLVGSRPLYLCCKGCVGKVESAPDAYLQKASQTSKAQ